MMIQSQNSWVITHIWPQDPPAAPLDIALAVAGWGVWAVGGGAWPGALTILGMSDSHFLFERDRVVCLCQSRVREIIRAPRRSYGSVQLPWPRAIGAVKVFSGKFWARLRTGTRKGILR